MPTIRDLEDLIIDAIYLDILRGKLDQKEQQLEIEYTMGRDLEPGKVEDVLAALKNWCVFIFVLRHGVLCRSLERIQPSNNAVLSGHQQPPQYSPPSTPNFSPSLRNQLLMLLPRRNTKRHGSAR